MPAATATKPPTQRKRNRKRKRRAASTSASSPDSSTEDEAPKKTTKVTPVQPQPESDSSSDSDSSKSGSMNEENPTAEIPRGKQPQNVTPKAPPQHSPSPSPPPATLPSFLPSSENAKNDAESREKELEDRFRQFWMTSVADGFKDDLEEIRKEPNLVTSRLSLLIDSLAAGADVFSSSSNDQETLNEMDLILDPIL